MTSPPPPVGPGGPPVPDAVHQVHGRGGVRGVLQITVFRRLYVALAMSSMGDWLGFLATTALAAQLMDTFAAKAYATGGVLVFRLLPAVLFGPLAGAFADRWDRRWTMVIADLVRFALFLSIPLVGLWTGGGTPALVWLLAASFLIETASLFWIPAKEASIPNLVSRERLESANQLTLVATYGSAPVAAGVFAVLSLVSKSLGDGVEYFATGPVDLALYVNASTFLFAAATVYRLGDGLPSPGREERAKQRAAGQIPPTVLQSLREGLGFMGRTPLTRGLLVGMLGALAAGGAIIALGRLFSESVLGGGDAAYGLLFGAMFLGIALGVALGPRLLGDLSRRRAFGLAIVLAGSALVFMSLVPVLALATFATMLVGFGAGIAYVVGITLLGLEIEDHLRGRMFGLVQSLMRIDLLLVTASAPFIAGAIGEREISLGPLSFDINGVSVVLLVGGLLGVVVGVASYRQMDDRKGVPLRADLLAAFRRTPQAAGLAGRFVALEGGEGAGKSTQLELLAGWLRDRGYEVVVTREPGATEAGARLRQVLLDPTTRLAPRAEALLYAADRAQHVAQVVRPALRRGAVVLTDRYVDSSLAYQGAGRELERDDVARLSRWATEDLVPDLVVLLDVDPEVGLRRARAGGTPDRIEAESRAFHDRVREGFRDLASKAPDRYLVVDAAQPPERVQEAIRSRLTRMLPAPQQPAAAS